MTSYSNKFTSVYWTGGSGNLSNNWITGYDYTRDTNNAITVTGPVYGSPNIGQASLNFGTLATVFWTSTSDARYLPLALAAANIPTTSLASGGVLTGSIAGWPVAFYANSFYDLQGSISAPVDLLVYNGTLAVDGVSSFIDTPDLQLGYYYYSLTGNVLIEAGGTATVGYVGDGTDVTTVHNFLGVDGSGSVLDVTKEIDIGAYLSSGTLSVTAGGFASAPTLGIGSDGYASISVDGTGSLLQIGTLIDVPLQGYLARGYENMTVGHGATVDISTMWTLSGLATIDASSVVDVGGPSTLSAPTGLVVGQDGTLALWGTIVAASATVLTGGIIAGDTLLSSGSLIAGVIDINAGGTIIATSPMYLGGNVVNNGVIAVQAGSSLEITGTLSGTGTIVIGDGATLRLDGPVNAGESIVFTTPSLYAGGPTITTETLIVPDIGAFSATIENFQTGNVIDLTNVSSVSVQRVGTTSDFQIVQQTTSQVPNVLGTLDLAGAPTTLILAALNNNYYPYSGSIIQIASRWPTGTLAITLDSGGDWSAPDANQNSTYIGDIDVGLVGGESLLHIVGGTIQRDQSQLVISSGATVYSLMGTIAAPILSGAFTIGYSSDTVQPITAQPNYLAQLPITAQYLQLGTNAIGIGYAMTLPGGFAGVYVPAYSNVGTLNLTITDQGFQLGGTPGGIALPTITNKTFFDLFTASFTQGTISVTPSGSAIHIQGSFVAAAPFATTITPTVTLDIAGPTNFISIVDNAGTVSYGAAFAFSTSNWTMPGGWALDNLSGSVDTISKTISVSGSLDIPFNTRIDIGLAGSIDFTYNPWILNDISLGVSLAGGGIPLPSTPLWLTSVAGSLTNISPASVNPITLTGTLGFDVAPSVANFHLGDFSVAGSYVAGQSFTGSLSAEFGVFAGTALGTITGSETFDWADGSATGNGALDLLENAFAGTVTFHESPTAFDLSGSGTLTIPKTFSFGTTTVNTWSRLVGKSLTVNLGGGYIFSGPQEGGSILASGTIDLGAQTYAGITRDVTITAGISITLPGPAVASDIGLFGGLSLAPIATVPVAADQAPIAFSSVSATASPVYSVPADSPVLILSANWTIPVAGAPSLSLIAPDGTVIDQSGFAAAGILDVTSLDSPTAANVAIVNPASGNWQLQINDTTGLGTVSFDGFASPAVPTLTLATPLALTDGTWQIGWTAGNYPANATITFYAAGEASTLDGTPISDPIAASASGQFTWNGSDVPPGNYYVYAQIAGPGIPPVTTYASSQPLAVSYSEDLTVGLIGAPTIIAGGTSTVDVIVGNLGSLSVGDASILMQVPNGFAIAAGQPNVTAEGQSWLVQFPTIAAGSTITVPIGLQSDGSTTGLTSTFIAALNMSSANASTAGNDATFALSTVECFAKGTHIGTVGGEVLIEDLAVGDLIAAHFARQAKVKWIGQRTIDCRHHPHPEKVWPIQIRANAFGQGMPKRDLCLSPGHAILVDHVLVPVGLLVDGVSIIQRQTTKLSYFHIELEAHDAIYAEGLLAESYLDVGDRRRFFGQRDVYGLFDNPDAIHDLAQWRDAFACAPLVLSGPPIVAARKTLAACRHLLHEPDRQAALLGQNRQSRPQR
jgi:hypothetical protein